jgi:hypothetical protein
VPLRWRFDKRSSVPLRFISLVASAALILSQAFFVLHFALVPHRICAIHGLEDAPAAEVVARPAHRNSSHGSTTASTEASDGAHERCALASCVHERLSLARIASVTRAEAPAAVRAAPITRDVSLGPSRALYQLAPKHGPPA